VNQPQPLTYQNHPNFELLIITDQPEAVARLSHADRAQIFTCQSANIATARNIGLAHAAGEIIAFCDDDALPEPTWLARLIAPFAQDNLGAVSGPVIGRNGVSQQWGLCEIGDDGADTRLPEPQDTRIFAPKRPRAIKTAGTNCAFARAVFDQLGGFDEAFHYYLDEADVNLRRSLKSVQATRCFCANIWTNPRGPPPQPAFKPPSAND